MNSQVWVAHRKGKTNVVEASGTFRRLVTTLPSEWKYYDTEDEAVIFREPEGSYIVLRPITVDLSDEN